MWGRSCVALISALLFSGVGVWQVAAPPPVAAATEEGIDGLPASPDKIVPDEVLVQYKTGWPEKTARRTFADSHGLREKRADPDTNWFRYKITDSKSPQAKMKELRGLPEVADVAPNVYVQLEWTPTGDELYGQQWSLPKVSMPGAWNYARGGLAFPNFIAIIDSGAPIGPNGTGPSELGNWKINGVWYGHTVVDPDPTNFGDCYGHGTMVASIAAAMANNGGMTGIAFNTGVMPEKFTDCFGAGTADDAAAAIEWAIATGHARVINCSFKAEGTDAEIPSLKAAVDHAWSHNISVVAAAGNDGLSNFNYIAPARWYHAIAVAATGPDDKRALAPPGAIKECHFDWQNNAVVCTTFPPGYAFPNYGEPGLDVSAPGVDILGVLIPDNQMGQTAQFYSSKTGSYYAKMAGTSFAAPIVSGTISLMLQRRSLTSAQVKTALWKTADRVGGYNYNWKTSACYQSAELGCGRLNAQKAVIYYG